MECQSRHERIDAVLARIEAKVDQLILERNGPSKPPKSTNERTMRWKLAMLGLAMLLIAAMANPTVASMLPELLKRITP
jgi:hypothetical protein